MEMKYDKKALQEYIEQVGSIEKQMRLKQDESVNLFISCKQRYNHIYAKLEETVRKVYNQLEDVESMVRSAELEYEAASKTVENTEEDTSKSAVQRLQRAGIMRQEADEAYAKVSADYSKVLDNLRSLSALWEGNVPALEVQMHRIEDNMAFFARLVANCDSDIIEYMCFMDKANIALYEGVDEDPNIDDSSFFSSELNPRGTASFSSERENGQTGSTSVSTRDSVLLLSTNNQIAATMIFDGLAGQVDFGELDNRTAQDIYKSVSETLEMFPELNLRFVGSIQSRNRHIEKSLEKKYFDIYRQYYPTASDEELFPFVRRQISEVMKEFQPSERTIAQSLFIETPQSCDEDVLDSFNGISINERYGKDYNFFIDTRRSDVEAKWKPEGCDTPRATVDHELGHQVARLTNACEDFEIQRMYSEFMLLSETQRQQNLSGYAGISIHEFIAEGWSEYRNNPNCRDLAVSISNRLFDLYENQNSLHRVRVRR